MEFEGKYFVFDWGQNVIEGTAFAVMQVRDGTLEDRFHPEDYNDLSLGREEDNLAVKYLKDNGVTQVYTTKCMVESPDTFLGRILWQREEITDPDLEPGQWSFYHYANLDDSRIKRLEKEGIIVTVIDPNPYIAMGERPREEPNPQLEFGF